MRDIPGLTDWLRKNRDPAYSLLRRWFALNRPFLLASDLACELEKLGGEPERGDLVGSPLETLVHRMQEGVFLAPWAYFSLREGVAVWRYARMHAEHAEIEEITAADFLRFKERIIDGAESPPFGLELDFGPFNREFPKLKEARSIGQGVGFLNRQLASQIFSRGSEGEARLFEFLRLHGINGQQLLVYQDIAGLDTFRDSLRQALEALESIDEETPWSEFAERLRRLGLAPGWGSTAGKAAETISMLVDLFEAPSPSVLEAFLARVPMVSKVLILSPHGYFGQENVLGLPDTGGQVVYILDQVRALEKEMRERLEGQGVAVEPKILIVTRLIPDSPGTTCGQRLEKVAGCANTWILRVPFLKENGEIVRHWISRFEVWPYLETFAVSVEREAVAEFSGRPDLIIGNYSDGNLVASLLSQRLGVTQCNIAHALEKTKYLLSAVYWRNLEDQYHFSCQFTADLIAMNNADFVIASTYQEIAGTDLAVGQYESYRTFTMPGLYRVLNGVDLFDPKFNIVSPGADASVYFPYHQEKHRLAGLASEIDTLLFGDDPGLPFRGHFSDPGKPLVFTMARLDHVKNLTGLAAWFGADKALRREANLLIVGGYIDPDRSSDHEEQEQIRRMHALMDQYGLDGEMRWIGARLEKNFCGELYRAVADHRGIFVQPALFEAFGLTVIEAMASGLPTFATCYGGPLEIIQDGRSGFHINPNDGQAATARITDFLSRCGQDFAIWEKISRAAIRRVAERYTWSRYAERMMTLARIYGFWKFVSGLERQETARYLNMFYHLQYRPLAAKVASGQM